jgi:hypothetical protein
MPQKTLSNEQFLIKIKAIHALSDYDYSQAIYINSRVKVKIICLEHGPFEQTPKGLYAGSGCPKCGWIRCGYNKLNTADFIAEAEAVHGKGAYDYSQTIYTGDYDKLTIVCSHHGAFEQRAQVHKRGSGCPKCAQDKNSLSLASFIARAKAKHEGRYNYSEVLYSGAFRKVSIICPVHGVFEQSPTSHLAGRGCHECGSAKSAAANAPRMPTLADFIAKAQAVHGIGAYDYSNSEYAGAHAKLRIACPVHGVFEQSPTSHLGGAGCRKCGNQRMIELKVHTVADFIPKARSLHGTKYDYSQVIYQNAHKKVLIICPLHGPFKQEPTGHLRGAGCPTCGHILVAESVKLDWVQRASGRVATLYFIRLFSDAEQFYKVGITCLSVAARFSSGTRMGGYHYEVLATHKSTNAAAVWDWEQSILGTFAHLRYYPKKPFDGQTECFSSADEILAIFPL